jgi:hypothetical protein
MTKEEAVAVINGEKNIEETLPQETAPQAETEVQETETEVKPEAAEAETSETPENNDETGDESALEDPEKVNKDETKARKKKKYTQLEKQQFAFKMQKARRKKAEEALAARNKEIEELKAQLEKYKGLSLEDFGNDQEKYMDYRLDQRLGNEKVKSMSDAYDREKMELEMEEAAEIANTRLENCYPDEVERNKYQALIQNAETNFANMHPEIGYNKFSDFLLSEKDRSVLQYLQDSDNAPKLINHFIHKPEAALRIMMMRNPNLKFLELKQLENRMIQHERMVKSRNASNASNASKVPEVKKLPDTGKTLTNSTIDTGIDWNRPWTKQDAINYIRNNNH